MTCKKSKCNGKPLADESYSYWEAWQVRKGGRKGVPLHKAKSSQGAYDVAKFAPIACGVVDYTQHGEVRFYCNEEVGLDAGQQTWSIPGWDPAGGAQVSYPSAGSPCATSAGNLTSTGTEPDFWKKPSSSQVEGASRSFWLKAKCCPKKEPCCGDGTRKAESGGNP